MRMAKPTVEDLDAAGDLITILQTIDGRFGGPWETSEGPKSLEQALGEDGDFDCDNPAHLQGLYNSLASLLRNAKNFYGRVIGGMCYVICYEENQILDPDDRCIELHPNIRQGLQLLEQQHSCLDLDQLEREAKLRLQAYIEQIAEQHRSH